MKRYRIYYSKDPSEIGDRLHRELFMGSLIPTEEFVTNSEYYVDLKTIFAKDLEDVYYKMQGEIWSANENQESSQRLIRSKGLQHTSMSTGDVVVNLDTNEFFVVRPIGWTKLEKRWND